MTQLEQIKAEIELYVEATNGLLQEAKEKNQINVDYYAGYVAGLQLLLKKINGEEKFTASVLVK